MARHRPVIYREPPLVVRRLTADMAGEPFQPGQLVVGRQTRRLEINDWVLIARDDHEYLAQIQRHQGDLIYYVTTVNNSEPVWLHAKYIVAKIIWPKELN